MTPCEPVGGPIFHASEPILLAREPSECQPATLAVSPFSEHSLFSSVPRDAGAFGGTASVAGCLLVCLDFGPVFERPLCQPRCFVCLFIWIHRRDMLSTTSSAWNFSSDHNMGFFGSPAAGRFQNRAHYSGWPTSNTNDTAPFIPSSYSPLELSLSPSAKLTVHIGSPRARSAFHLCPRHFTSACLIRSHTTMFPLIFLGQFVCVALQ